MTRDPLLPGFARPWLIALSETSARMLETDTDAVRRERYPLECDAQFIAPLAWERSVHFWRPGDDAGNRERIASSFEDHCAYGSPSALEAEISLDTGQCVRVVEWFEDPKLEWPDFYVDTVISPGDPTPDVAALFASAKKRKNVRDWPSPRVRALQPPAAILVTAAVMTSASVTVLPLDHSHPPAFVAGATLRAFSFMKVLPFKS